VLITCKYVPESSAIIIGGPEASFLQAHFLTDSQAKVECCCGQLKQAQTNKEMEGQQQEEVQLLCEI
jgi:hypothetical protein